MSFGGWFGESYRHSLASRGISTGRSRSYFSPAIYRLPRKQLAEIRRLRGDDVAQEAEDVVVKEQLTAKELSDRYGVPYVRKPWERSAGVRRFADGERRVRRPEAPLAERFTPEVSSDSARQARLEAFGRRQYADMLSYYDRRLGEVVGEREGVLAKLAEPKDLSANEVLQLQRDAKALESVRGALLRSKGQLERDVRDRGYVAAVPPEYLRDDVPVPGEDVVVPVRVGRGQSRLEEFGGERRGVVQSRVTEFFKHKSPVSRVRVEVERPVAGRVYPVSPDDVRSFLRDAGGDARGLSRVAFVNPRGEQHGAWAQYVRRNRTIKVFSQPRREVDRDVHHMIRGPVLRHELGHHVAMYKRKITDPSLSVAEARADAYANGFDVQDRDVRRFVRAV